MAGPKVNNWSVVLHEFFCCVLLWSVFCRFTKSDDSLLFSIRLAFFGLGIAACLGITAPVSWGYDPHPVSLVMLGAFAIVQVVTAAHWKDGPPVYFIKPRFGLYRRRRTDSKTSEGFGA